MKNVIFASCFLLSLFGCKKVEGEGGSATIKGVVIEQRYNSLGNIIAEYPAPDQNVYIIYGDQSTFYDDDISTSYDGSFEFRYLQKGKYSVFVYEDCASCLSGTKEKISNIEITKRDQIITLDTIFIKKL
jgi:hypothetical protein